MFLVYIYTFVSFAVGGVMAFLTLHEMLPLAFDYAGQKQAVKAVFLGMAFMSARWVSILCIPLANTSLFLFHVS